jgi:hypothetical protein
MSDRTGEIDSSDEDYINKAYLGIVEDPNDPKKEGRCKIRIFGLHEEDITVEDLPWAYPKQKSAFFGQDGQGGSISIPKKDSVVAVMFNNGNVYSPEYYTIQELATDVKDELTKEGEYLGTHIVLFDGDEELKIWFTVNKGLTIQLKNSKINIGQDKAILIEHADTSSSIELRGGEININANSTINLTSNSEIEAASNDVWINGNFVTIGHGPVKQPAVLGDNLFLCLTQLAAVIDAKYYPTPGVASGIVNAYKSLVLSQTVEISM